MSETLRILLADDDHNMTRVLATIWRRAGYAVEVASSGSEALDKISEESFDCVLSDFKMPGIDGIKLCDMVRGRQPELPVVLMTAYSDASLIQEGLAKGAVAVLKKPLDVDIMLEFFAFLRRERSIVVVDDDARFCETLGDLLRARGYGVTLVGDPREALENVGEVKVVLWGVKPGNVQVLERVRQRHPRLAVILMDGGAAEAALGPGEFLLDKPFEIETLVRLLVQIRRQELSRMLAT